MSLTKTSEKSWRRIPMWAAVAGIVAVAAGVTLWVWAPWVDRSPFTAYTVGVQDEEHTVPGSTPNSCVRTAASGEETVIYDEDGKRLASGRAEREGERLGPEFGEWAGDCLIVTRIDDIPAAFSWSSPLSRSLSSTSSMALMMPKPSRAGLTRRCRRHRRRDRQSGSRSGRQPSTGWEEVKLQRPRMFKFLCLSGDT
ncbi:hypothetical protein AB0P36_31545 [Streptomyces flavidovirens]|uniref:hypothetical protein n=1 Tax=Streptomyces flavidovirens TaxID=67298 RepID=UPI00343342E9